MTEMARASGEDLLPVPMVAEAFANEFVDHVNAAEPGDRIGITTLQFAIQRVQEESIVTSVLEAMLAARERDVDVCVFFDERYTWTMSTVGNRDLPIRLPLVGAGDRAERRRTREQTMDLFTYLEGEWMLASTRPHRLKRGYVPLIRWAASLHPAQHLATVHTKAAYVERKGNVTAWLNSGNLRDADMIAPHPNNPAFGMNNISFRFTDRAATFIMRAVTNEFSPVPGSHIYGDKVQLIHDIGNNGEPARLPKILTEVLEAIDPRRESRILDPNDHAPKKAKAIALLSQYAPNGLLYNALEYVASEGTYVYVPLQPDDDHRSSTLPFSVNTALFNRRLRRAGSNSVIVSGKRKVPSHIKTCIVTYEDGTAKIIAGSDNLVTNPQKFVRNEELGVVISLDCKDTEDATYLLNFVNLLFDIGEIDTVTKDKLLEDVII